MTVPRFAPALAIFFPLFAQQPTPSPEANTIFGRTKAATVIILSGEGAGRLHSISTGVVISKDGVLLTALHAIKGAAEVQVRMANGDVFDRVEFIGADERRDVAALRISARAIPALSPGSTWTATDGILSAIRPAEEFPARDRASASCSSAHQLPPDPAVVRWLTVPEHSSASLREERG